MDYPKYHRGPNWIRKVKAMHSNQVIAVYYRLVSIQK